MGFSFSKYRRKVEELEDVIENVHNVPRERDLLIRILNQERSQVKEPIFIESSKKSRIHELDIVIGKCKKTREEGCEHYPACTPDKPKAGDEKTEEPEDVEPPGGFKSLPRRVWTRILSETNVGTTVLFEGTIDGNIWVGSKFEYLSKYQRIQTIVAMFALACYTIAWATLTISSGEGNLTAQGLWQSGWFPLAVGMVIPSMYFLKLTKDDTSLDILELTVEEDVTDSKDNQGYWCRLAHLQTDRQMEQSGVKAPAEYYTKIVKALDEAGKINAAEYKRTRRKNTSMKAELQVLKNEVDERRDSEYSTRTARENRKEWIATVRNIAFLGTFAFILWMLVHYEVIGG